MIVLVTGGSSGLGEAITRRLALGKGCTVYFTYNTSVVNAKKIEDDLPNTIALKCDFKNEYEVNSLKEYIAEINPDVMINNAYTGAFIKTYFHKTPTEDFLTEFKNNIIPTIVLTQAAINSFRKKKSGKIITILTAALVKTAPIGTSVYIANKAYLEKMSKAWATENAKYNITSNTISPSFMLTNFTKDIDERVVEQIKNSSPSKKLLTTQAVADTVFSLINTTQHLNGVDIAINTVANIE